METIKDLRENLTIEDFGTYGMIGFCKISQYRKESRLRAKIIMEEGIRLGLIKEHDFGRGKGKYTTTENAEPLPLRKIIHLIFENKPLIVSTEDPNWEYLNDLAIRILNISNVGVEWNDAELERITDKIVKYRISENMYLEKLVSFAYEYVIIHNRKQLKTA